MEPPRGPTCLGDVSPPSGASELEAQGGTRGSALLTGGLVLQQQPRPSVGSVRPGSLQVQAQGSQLSLEAQTALGVKYNTV